MTDLARFNVLPAAEAGALLASCCGSTAWVSGMIGRRPFASEAAVLDAAEGVFATLAKEDWLEAFRAHPRIGDSSARGQAAAEQAGARAAPEGTLAALAEANHGYEERFGHLFIVFASGKSADEMLDLCRRRLHNDREAELLVAAQEQRKITRRRLQELFAR